MERYYTMMNNIDKLKQLTVELPAVPKLSDLMVDGITINQSASSYDISGGSCLIDILLSQPEVLVAKCHVSKGCKFPTHLHGEKEYIIVTEGSMEFEFEGEKIKMKEGDAKMFDIGVSHSAVAIEDSWFILVNVPRSDDYKMK